MATKEEISMTGFAIVAYAGDAKTDLIDALNAARTGDFAHARELVASANDSIVAAHNEQTKLLSKEAGGEQMDVTFIMVHGQDTLMTTMMLKDQVTFFIDEYERIAAVEAKLGLTPAQ
ncbi:PTS lactose/cellobiose transporter subunit IIA [Lacticaseibacillus absianus]|uniref:PTS lactose/cellobiose transporter subunit IIA n=1 Tax=Lacticaseibacillus absianus TaxID=2729623 RepID=UPI0015CE3ECB|nr:PTS lactose/cellobiose transporter subunit IIA [Lacticaseibacillus absianus]